MPVITISMPQLQGIANALVDRMIVICQNGGGELPLTEIITLIPHLPDTTRNEFNDRGTIVFEPAGFSNHGIAKDIQFTHDNSRYRIEVPVDLKGNYSCYDNGFHLIFDDDKTILIGRKIFVWVKFRLERIDVNRQRIFIDMEGNAPDILINLQ